MSKLFIEKGFFYNKAVFIEKNEIIKTRIEHIDSSSDIGAIYLGRVIKLLPNIGGAFVDIGNGEEGFLNIKKDERKIAINSEILVQVKKDKEQGKERQLSSKISLNGMYAVVIPNESGLKISKKMSGKFREKFTSEYENFIEKCVLNTKECQDLSFEKFCIIIRSKCESLKSFDIVFEEIKEIIMNFQRKTRHLSTWIAPSVVYETDSFIDKVLKSDMTSSLEEIVAEDKSLIENSWAYTFSHLKPLVIQPKKMDKKIFFKEKINEELEKLIDSRVSNEIGVEIVIEKTEGFIAIDVNSARSTSNKKIVNTFTVNKAASIIIFKEIIKRNISGVVVIDFIDMSDFQKENLINYMRKASKKDSAKWKIFGFTKLGLLELSREKQYKSIYDEIASVDNYKILNSEFYFEKIFSEIFTSQDESIVKNWDVTLSHDLYNYYRKNKSKIDDIGKSNFMDVRYLLVDKEEILKVLNLMEVRNDNYNKSNPMNGYYRINSR